MRAKAQALFDAGLSRNAIARELDLDPATITRWARAEGNEFDRANVAAANKAHTVDLAAVRIELAQEMAAAGMELLKARHDPYLVYSFGGKNNTYAEHTLDHAPVEVVRSAVVTAGIAFDKATKVLEKDTTGVDAAHSLLDSIAAGFRSAAAQYETAADGE